MNEVCQFSTIPYQLKRSSRRRTLALQVGPQGLIVMSPLYLDKLQIDQFIQRKADWINTHLKHRQQRPQQGYTVMGEQLVLRDVLLRLRVVDDVVSGVTLEGQTLWVQLSRRIKPVNRPKQLLLLLEDWYQQEAQQYFTDRLAYWCTLMGLPYRQLLIKGWQTRWGSCHSDGTICLNWRLLLAPSWVSDYVVVHELAHLRQMNHSPAFWQLVAQYYPAWRDAKTYLKHHQMQLTLTADNS
ncbi:MAG: SprT family zinc-dependent metalloprotease [Rheinheimera sp.]|nr:SprT family zinc-dependent metalloprotease [Rheinheimera sp.]